MNHPLHRELTNGWKVLRVILLFHKMIVLRVKRWEIVLLSHLSLRQANHQGELPVPPVVTSKKCDPIFEFLLKSSSYSFYWPKSHTLHLVLHQSSLCQFIWQFHRYESDNCFSIRVCLEWFTSNWNRLYYFGKMNFYTLNMCWGVGQYRAKSDTFYLNFILAISTDTGWREAKKRKNIMLLLFQLLNTYE